MNEAKASGRVKRGGDAHMLSLDFDAAEAELAVEVARYLDGAVPLCHRSTTIERVGRFFDRNKVVLWLLAAYVVVRLVILAFTG
jgi:hypothetical protein